MNSKNKKILYETSGVLGMAIFLSVAILVSLLPSLNASAVVGDKDTKLKTGDQVPVIAFVPKTSDPSKLDAEGFQCQVLNAGDMSKHVETLLDCKPAKVLENGPIAEPAMNDTDG